MSAPNIIFILGSGSGGFSPDPPDNKYGPPGQLYNLREDLSEQNNLYESHPDTVYELTALLAKSRYQATAPHA